MNYLPNVVLFINKESYAENIMHPQQIRCLTFRYKVIQNFLMLNSKQDASWEDVENSVEGFWNGTNMSKLFITIYYQAVAKVFAQASVVIVTTTSALRLNHRLAENQKFRPFIGVLD